jgi:predicted Rossmann fold flavoprotein
MYDLIVIGSGAAGIMAALSAKIHHSKYKILLIEQLPQIALKLKATGGGRCNLTNTLDKQSFMEAFGKNGRFMNVALDLFGSKELQQFLLSIGVETVAKDGFRIFPIDHNSQTIIDKLYEQLVSNDITIKCNEKITTVVKDNFFTLSCDTSSYNTNNLIIATGGLGYKQLGSTGEGLEIAKSLGHKVTKLYPAMMPLHTKEKWVASCRADTIGKVTMWVDIKKYNKLKASGDIIFTKNGIRGPVVLDFAREITPLFDKYDEIPLVMNLIKGKNENDLIDLFKEYPTLNILDVLTKLLPRSVTIALLESIDVDPYMIYKNISGDKKQLLLKIFTQTPLHINGHDGFKNAMITRGGVSLKDIVPSTMESKIVDNLYFVGEIVDIDGPCGGYNLQWAFSSGYLAGKLL